MPKSLLVSEMAVDYETEYKRLREQMDKYKEENEKLKRAIINLALKI